MHVGFGETDVAIEQQPTHGAPAMDHQHGFGAGSARVVCEAAPIRKDHRQRTTIEAGRYFAQQRGGDPEAPRAGHYDRAVHLDVHHG